MAVRHAAVAWAAALVISCGLVALPLVAFAATFAVTIQNSSFNPPSTTVNVGDTVRWTNADPFSHTSTSDTGVWDTGVIGAGGSGSFTFASAGTFAYHCALHAFMKGTIIVRAASTPPPPTAPPTAPPTQQPTPPPTPLPTPVRTAPPTAAPTEAATTPPATPTPSTSPSPTAAVETLTVSASPSAAAVQLTPAPDAGGGPSAPLLLGTAALAVVALGGVAFLLARRS